MCTCPSQESTSKNTALKDCMCIVIRNRQLFGSLYLMELRSAFLAENTKPGQFVHLEIPTLPQHILRRPFSILDTHPDEGIVDILYQVVGDGTQDMANWQPGYLTRAIGPIGHEWVAPEGAKRVLLVGGGVGAAPIFMFCKQLVEEGIDVDVVLGAQTADALVCLEHYSAVDGIEPVCATDDGSFGHNGFCTTPAEELMDTAVKQGRPYDLVAVCGPEPLMKAVSEQAIKRDMKCQLSMEKRMACGIGACLSCVVNTTDGKKRACVDGPVFDAKTILW